MHLQIKSFEVMADASGAPAVISVNEFTFAFDMVGKMRRELIGGPLSWSAAGYKRVCLDLATREYQNRIAALGEQWRADNAAMYAD